MGGFWVLGMVKDEEDAIGGMVLHHASEGAAVVLLLDNGSTDGTRDAIADAAREAKGTRVVVRDDPEVGYFQSKKITALAAEAHEGGARWIVPVDADELWHADGETIASLLMRLDPNVNVLAAPLLSHFATSLDDEAIANPFQRLTYRQPNAAPLPKVAVRARRGVRIGQGAHRVHVPGLESSRGRENTGLAVRHFPYRSEGQFIRKVANGAKAYAATDLPSGTGDHWRRYGKLLDEGGPEALLAVWREFFHFTDPEADGLLVDPAPYRRW